MMELYCDNLQDLLADKKVFKTHNHMKIIHGKYYFPSHIIRTLGRIQFTSKRPPLGTIVISALKRYSFLGLYMTIMLSVQLYAQTYHSSRLEKHTVFHVTFFERISREITLLNIRNHVLNMTELRFLECFQVY